MITVTAIVPTYNRAEYLSECLKALHAQTHRPDEIIVVDDGSTDGTPAVVASFGRAVRYVRQENGGKSAALNYGLRLATGDAVWICDDDDLAVPTGLEQLAAALISKPEASMAVGGFERFVDEAGVRRVTRFNDPGFLADDYFFQQAMQLTTFQGAMLVRRSCYAATGPFDIDLPRAQDYDMLLRLAGLFRVVHVQGVIFQQRQHSGDRGPAHSRVSGHEVWRQQGAFDARVLNRVRAALPLECFLPGSQRHLIDRPSGRARALLRRAAAVGKRGSWTAAEEDLGAALRLMQEANTSPLLGDIESLSQMAAFTLGSPHLANYAKVVVAAKAAQERITNRRLTEALTRRLPFNIVKALVADRPTLRPQLAMYLRLTHGLFIGPHAFRVTKWLGSKLLHSNRCIPR